MKFETWNWKCDRGHNYYSYSYYDYYQSYGNSDADNGKKKKQNRLLRSLSRRDRN